MMTEVRHALRALARSWGVTVVAVLTLAVGIAVLTTIFSFVNSALFRPLPYPDSDRMFALSAQRQDVRGNFSQLPLRTVQELRASARSFDRLAAFRERSVTLSGVGDAAHVDVTDVDPALFPMLRARAQLGSLLTADQIRAREPLVVLSDRLWRERFGAVTDIVGRIVRIDGAPYTVIGVMERGFRFYERSDLWKPLIESDDPASAASRSGYSMIGRLEPGVALAQARSEVDLIGRRLAAAEPADSREWSLVVRDGMVDRGTRAWRPFAILLLGAAASVLLVASTNIVNLLLVRASVRRGEVAIRSALGASRRQLIRQSLTESLILAVAAGAVGALLSIWGVGLITALVPLDGMPSWVRFGVDLRVLAFAAAISLVTLLLMEVSSSLLVRAATDPDALKPAVAAAVRAIDPDQAVGTLQTMAAEMAIVTTVIRALAAIFGAFTICALALGVVGIYSVVAEGVAQRTREIGIRMALGATDGDVLRDVAGRGLRLTALGLAIGLPTAWMLSRAMGGVLYGIAPLHLGTYAGVALGFSAVTLVATYLPARRATRVDPATAIRDL